MNKSENIILQRVAQAVIGMPDNPDDNGMVGDVKEIEQHLRKLNGSVASDGSDISMLKWAVGGLWLLVLSLIGVVIVL